MDNPRCAVWASMGLGKTVATAVALDTLHILSELDWPVLVLAPLRVAKSTWPNEIKKWDELKHLRVSAIHGSEGRRRKALHTAAEIYTMNYDNIPWLVEYCRKTLGYWPFKAIVADESTKLKGFRTRQGTKRAKMLAQVAHEHTDRFIELSGTPAPNGLKDLWGQLWFLDLGRRLGRSFTAFKERWFYKDYEGYGVKPLQFAQDQIQKAVGDVCLSLDAKDYFDIKEPIRRTIYVDLPPKAQKRYDEMEKDLFTEIESAMGTKHEVEAFNAAAKTNKLLQLASGAAYTDYIETKTGRKPTSWQTIHNAKIEALEDIIEEAAGAPVLVAYFFKTDLKRILKAFPNARHLDADPQTEQDWNDGKIPILVAHPASAGHGLNLQHGGHHIACFSHTWDLEHYLQILERIGPVRQLQSGYDRPVFIYDIVARGTVDELVMLRRESKRGVQDILLEAVKRRKI